MSCIKCDEFQDDNKTAFYRWKNANIEVRACREHMLEVFNVLNETQKKEEDDEKEE